jgi:4-amino-4-deoxy-L-arabinose transferase-like glycosyltransferase
VRSERRDAVFVAAVSLAVRLAVVVWAAGRFPPTADGRYYHQIATRIAEGHGYTWLWPDGAVTYAAHYPVGYPAMVALGYAVFGAKPVVAMTTNALVGAAAAVAAWSLLRRGTSRGARLALAGGLAVGLHPVLVPYTAAVMTEGVTASLLVVAAAVAAGARDAREPRRWIVLTGVLMGIATLVRPQSLALAPVLGWLAVTGRAAGVRRAATGAAAVTALALAVCAPWTARNCVRMERCALVSVNGGWNLAIGVQTETGGWHEISVPEACKTVFQEAAKDACFGRVVYNARARAPGGGRARAPAKLRMTFDYFGAAPWYLHDANASSFPHRAKVALGAVETLVSRLFLAAALVALLRIPPPRTGALGRARTAAVAVGLVACVLVPGTIGYLALALGVAALGPSALRRAPLVIPFSAAVIVATAATHAVFFGAGRYGIIVVPFVTMLAFVRAPEREGEGRPVA